MAMVAHTLSHSEGIEHRICVTAQHREMLDAVLSLFDLRADYDLDLMQAGQDVEHLTCAVILGVANVLSEAAPDRVLVHGDTTTALGAALAGYYAKAPVGHVEAGLRTGDRYAPWPEEMNRRLADALCDRHYAPTEGARKNLLFEGTEESGIVVTGNTGIDALIHMSNRLRDDANLAARARRGYPPLSETRRLVLVTAHRRESFGDGIERICRGLANVAARDDVEIVFPVHPNPRVLKPVRRFLGGMSRVHLTAPLDYLTFVALMMRSYMIITDSGGIQEEAPALGKPVLLLRDLTERPEGVAAGTMRVVGTDPDRILSAAATLLDDREVYSTMAQAHNPYGDGRASDRILRDLLNV